MLDGAVFLGDSIVLLPAAVSRSLPAVVSRAIGFAEPRLAVRSPGPAPIEEEGADQDPVRISGVQRRGDRR